VEGREGREKGGGWVGGVYRVRMLELDAELFWSVQFLASEEALEDDNLAPNCPRICQQLA